MLRVTLAYRRLVLMLYVSHTHRSWVLMLLSLRPLVLMLCTRRPWVLMLGGTHPPFMGAGVVGPMPTHVAYPSSVPIGSGVDVAMRTSGPTLADARSDIL